MMARTSRNHGAWCKVCNAPLMWVRTSSDSWMPLDESHDAEGRWVIESGNRARKLMGVALEVALAEGRLLFTSHFETCAGNRKPGSGRMPPEVREQMRKYRTVAAKPPRGLA